MILDKSVRWEKALSAEEVLPGKACCLQVRTESWTRAKNNFWTGFENVETAFLF